MPQLNQLPDIFWSQLFWLTVVFGIIFFAIGRGMVPKIQGAVDLRERQIADDLGRAQAARKEADETEAAWRARMDVARVDAARIAQEAKTKSSLDTEGRVKSAGDEIARKVDAAETRLREAVGAARAEIEGVAVEATREMVQRLAGIELNAADAAAAVKAELNV